MQNMSLKPFVRQLVAGAAVQMPQLYLPEGTHQWHQCQRHHRIRDCHDDHKPLRPLTTLPPFRAFLENTLFDEFCPASNLRRFDDEGSPLSRSTIGASSLTYFRFRFTMLVTRVMVVPQPSDLQTMIDKKKNQLNIQFIPRIN